MLLLVGVVSVLTLHAQMSSASALRRARLEATRAMLRAAASDAAWIALKNAPSGGPTNAIGLPVRRRLPSGAELETRINPQPEELARYAQAIARLTGGGADPGVWAIEVTASSSNVSERVGCYYRPQGGSKEVLGWYED